MEEAKLRQIVDEFRSDPSALRDPSLKFFTDYLLSLGARIPSDADAGKKSDARNQGCGSGINTDETDEIIGSDIEIEGEVVEADDDPPQQMGDLTAEVTEERYEAAALCKRKAMTALSEGHLEASLKEVTEAIRLNPKSSIFYATRAIVFLKMGKPNAAIRDAEAALQINPDLAKGYKSRGMARALLGKWEEAASDLRLASKLDYDEEIHVLLKEKIEPNLHKIEERLRKDREIRKATSEKQRKCAKTQDIKTHDSETLEALGFGTVITIQSSKEVETKLKTASTLNRLVILYFTATWCGPCRFMAPVYTKLAEKYPNAVFLKLDIDQVSSVAQSWNISSVPSFFFVRQGKEVDKIVGADKGLLERKIELHIGKP